MTFFFVATEWPSCKKGSLSFKGKNFGAESVALQDRMILLECINIMHH